MKAFLLFNGEYEQRFVHSVHSTREKAELVASICGSESDDIEEHELDAEPCDRCGYGRDSHDASWSHPFVPMRAASQTDAVPTDLQSS